MSAVSLEDAWNDVRVEEDDKHILIRGNNVSSKKTHVESPKEKQELKEKEEKEETEQFVFFNRLQTSLLEQTTYMQNVLSEFKEFRQEESKRCTVYMVLCGLFFAVLIMYIDKLQSKIRDLHSHVHRIHWMQSAGDTKVPPSEFAPWMYRN